MTTIQLFDDSDHPHLEMDGQYHADGVMVPIDSFASRVSYLSESLSLAGLSSLSFPAVLLEADAHGSISRDQCQIIIDGMMDMWKDRQKYQTQVQQVGTDVDRLKSDLAHANQRIADLKEEKADAEKKMWEIEMKRRSSEKEFLSREKSLRSDLVALEKKCVMIQRRDNQYKHELRKVEQNFEKVQEKLHKMILEKTSGSTFGSSAPLSARGSAAASANSAPNGGWDLASTMRTSSRAPSSSGASSADLELLQGTLATYSERLSQLVSENHAVKASLRQLEGELQAVISDDTTTTNDPDADKENEFDAVDESGVPIARELLCLSPRSRQLLADFTPAQIELPWDLAGADVEAVLRAKMQLVRARVQAQRAAADAAASRARDESTVAALQARLLDQAQIIREQDALLRAALDAPEREGAFEREREEARRLSLRVEAEDARRLRARAASATVTNAMPMASPVSLKILGGRSAASLPELDTPVFVRKASHARVPSSGSPASVAAAAVAAAPKSKWLAGGVLTTPTFTPSKRSTMRRGSAESANATDEDEDADLSSIGLDADDDDVARELEEVDAAAHALQSELNRP